MKKILVNKAKCKRCGDVLTSTWGHDYVTCSCGGLSVDGGKTYIRRCYEYEGIYEEMSEYENNEV